MIIVIFFDVEKLDSVGPSINYQRSLAFRVGDDHQCPILKVIIIDSLYKTYLIK